MISKFCIINKVKNNKSLVYGSLFSIYSFTGKGINFIILLLLANYISPSEYGYLNLFMTFVSFITIFIAFSTNGYLGISYFQKPIEEFKKDLFAIFFTGILTLLFFSLLIISGGDYLSQLLKLQEKILVYAVFVSFFTFSFLLQQDYLRVREKVGEYGIYNISNAFLNLILTFIFVVLLYQGWIGRVNAMLLCSLVFGVISICFFIKHELFRVNFNIERYKTILSWGIPMIPHNAAGWLRQGLDRYIINYSYSVYEVGIFSFALNISNVIEMVGLAFNATNSVSLYQTLSNKELSNDNKLSILNRQSRNIGIVYFVATIIIAIFATLLTCFFFPQYQESIPYIYILCVCGFLKCLYFLYCNYLFYYSKTKQLMYITFFTSTTHLLLSLLLTHYSLYFTSIIYVLIQAVILCLVVRQRNLIVSQNLKR